MCYMCMDYLEPADDDITGHSIEKCHNSITLLSAVKLVWGVIRRAKGAVHRRALVFTSPVLITVV